MQYGLVQSADTAPRMNCACPLDIAFLCSSDTKTGTYFRYHNLAMALVNRGHRLTVYSQNRYKRWKYTEEQRDGVHYIIAPSVPGDQHFGFAVNPANIIGRCLTSWALLAKHDVYHLFQPHFNAAFIWLGIQTFHRRFLCARRAVFAWDWDDLWGGDGLAQVGPGFGRQEVKLINRMEKLLPSRADLVTTCSTFLANFARRQGAREVSIVHNGFWPQSVPITGMAKVARRRALGLVADAFYLAFTGWTLGEIHWCLDVVEALLPRYSVRLVCCGHDIRPYLAQAPPAVRESVDYLGVLNAAETRQVMEVLDVGLLPMPWTQFNQSRMPMKFAEYLAAGLAVMCGATGEVSILGGQLEGVYLLPSDRQGWTAGCVEAIGGLIRGTSPVTPDRHPVSESLAWPALTKKLEAAYRHTLSKVSGSTLYEHLSL